MHSDNRHFTSKDGSIIPVGTLYCIGRNYSAHAKEMGAEVPTNPLVFIKPPSAYLAMEDCTLHRPSYSIEMHHEVEIAVIIQEDIPEGLQSGFQDYIAGYALALDLTLRDIQTLAKQKGEPWSISKSFKHSTPVSHFIPASQCAKPYPDFTFSLDINGVRKQTGNTATMERHFEHLLAYCHSIFGLRKGDCILTGTPEGVGPLYSGDSLLLTLDSFFSVSCVVA